MLNFLFLILFFLCLLKFYDWQSKIISHLGSVTIRAGRQCGKSLAVAHRIFKLASDYPGSRTLIVAASERQENYIYERVRELIKKNYVGRSTLSRTQMKNGSLIFKFPVGQTGIYLEGLPSVDFLHADEAIHIKPNVWNSILPMLAEPRKRGLGWVTLLSSTRGRPKGYFRDSFNDSEFLKIVVKASDCPHISPDFLLSEKIRLGPTMYGVIYDAEFNEHASSYFIPEHIDYSVKIASFSKKEINRSKNFYLGIDPARYGRSFAVFVVAELLGDVLRIVYLEKLAKTSLTDLELKTELLDTLFSFRKIFIDDGGFGAGLVDILEKKFKRRLFSLNNASSGKKNKTLKEDLYSNFARLLSEQKVLLLNDEDLIKGLKSVEFDDDEKIKGTDVSEAVVRSAWCLKEKYIKPRILTF